MGLAASQARLLSITARLTHNETQSQLITNAKLRLADKSNEASQEYIEALNATKFVYTNYTENGNRSTQDLNFGAVNQYNSFKNQYIFKNNNGQVLVNSADSDNFKSTGTLYEFLNKYGLFENGAQINASAEQAYQDEYAKYLQEKNDYDRNYSEWYNSTYKPWLDEKTKNDAEWDSYNRDHAAWEAEKAAYEKGLSDYQKQYEEWLQSNSGNGLYETFSGAVGTSDIKDGPELYGSKGCYWHALNPVDQNSASCYAHVLNHLIDFDGTQSGNNGNGGLYTTSYGDLIVIREASCGYMANTCNAEMAEVSAAINEKDENGNYERKCDGTDDFLNISGVQNQLAFAKEEYAKGRINATQLKMYTLLSDFIDNGDGTYSIKSLKQKAIDMMYISRNWGPAVSDDQSTADACEFPESILSRDYMVNMLINYTDGDMRKLSDPPPPYTGTLREEPNEPKVFTTPEPQYDKYPPQEPTKPILEEKILDQPKAQWYINLWYAMNGYEDAAKLYTKYEEATDTTYFTVPDKNKDYDDNKCCYYKVIDPTLEYSESWLNNAMEMGMITVSQAIAEVDDDDLSYHKIQLKNVGYTSISEFVEETDELAISRAEIKYQQATNEIQAKDKKYDNDLKKLDSTHNALQTEYDSIKSVIEKNTERSFKAFS